MKNAVRAVIYAPAKGDARSQRGEWIERELRREEIVIQIGRGITDVIAALLDDPAPRPQILVVDFDTIHPAEVLELHSIRERGWCGTIFGLGKVNAALRKSLCIEQVLDHCVDNALRGAVADVGFDAQTRRLPVFNY